MKPFCITNFIVILSYTTISKSPKKKTKQKMGPFNPSLVGYFNFEQNNTSLRSMNAAKFLLHRITKQSLKQFPCILSEYTWTDGHARELFFTTKLSVSERT